MASKVCPVCKSFTSTSNTTLNAHIDQCLSSVQSNAARDVTEFPRAKVKARKKRLMVDIYTTAPHCTLEDLDRRNGRVVGLAVVAPSNDVALDNRRPKLSPLEAVSDDVNLEPRKAKLSPPLTESGDANLEMEKTRLPPLDALSEGNVGDIYIDSNGTKLLILSKFNDSPSLAPRKKLKMKKHGKGLKSGKSCPVAKKKILKQMCSEFMGDNQQNRKLSAGKEFISERIEETTGSDDISKDHQEREESGSQVLNTHDQVNSTEPSTLGHWVCSKRSDFSRKHASRDINRGPEKMIVNARKLSFRQTPPELAHPSTHRTCSLNLASSAGAAAFPKTKCMNFLSNTSRGMDSGRKTSLRSSNVNLKLFEDGSLGGSHMVRVSCPSEHYHPSLKVRKSWASKKSAFPRRAHVSLGGMKADKSERFVTPEKFKHRSILGCSKEREVDKYRDVNGGSDVSTEVFCPTPSRDNEASQLHGKREIQSTSRTDLIRSTVTDAPAHDANLRPSTEEQVECSSHDGTQAEVLVQRSTSYELETRCGNGVGNEVISQEFRREGCEAEEILQNGELLTDTSSSQNPDRRVSCEGEVALEAIQENSSTNLVGVEPIEDHRTVVDMESSVSAVSTVPAISRTSPTDDKIKDPEAGRSAEHNLPQDKVSSPMGRKDNNVKLPPSPREPSCCCSESLARESQFSNHRKSTVSNLFIKPPVLSSFQQVCSSLESHTGSVVTMDSSKSASKASTPCSGSPSAPNPILRLMGKDLVVSKEECTHLPAILPCDSQAKFISFVAPSNVGFTSYHNPYSYPIQSFVNHQIPLQPLQIKSDKLGSPSPWRMNRMIAPQHHQPRPTATPCPPPQEVIVIDDDPHGFEPEPRARLPTLLPAVQNPNLVAAQRVFACFPSQSPFASRAFVPSQREASEGSFMFPSPSSLYFSPTLR